MRICILKPFNDITVDLDDEYTFESLPKDLKELRDLFFKEVGYAHCYMNFWHKDVFDDENFGKNQKELVNKLISNFTENERYNCDNVKWYQEQVFVFQNEIENMC